MRNDRLVKSIGRSLDFLVIVEGVNSTQLSAANFRTVPGQFTIWV
ncbi:hypothetical protein [Roseofilum sp. Guam]|nr:hypothetical protein [Roseofilum sp. Guam]